MGTEFLVAVGVVALAAVGYWVFLTWLIGAAEINIHEPAGQPPQSIRELVEGRTLYVGGDRFVTERELLAQIGATYEPPSFQQPAAKGWNRELRAVSGGKVK